MQEERQKLALILVWDKTGLKELAYGLAEWGYEFISTGTTAQFLIEAGFSVHNLEDWTDYYDFLDEDIKILHPKIYASLLASEDNKEHLQKLEEYNIPLLELIVINLYPFEQINYTTGILLDEVLGNIDIGGITLLRAGAKNFQRITVISNTSMYKDILTELQIKNGELSATTRLLLARKAYELTSRYDNLIAEYLAEISDKRELLQKTKLLPLELNYPLRYGENLSQIAAFYTYGKVYDSPLEQLAGKNLSFNNLCDLDVMLSILAEFDEEAIAVLVKHTNPSSVAIGNNILEAYLKAYTTDPQYILDSVIGFSKPVDDFLALELSKISIKIIAAPDFTPEALSILTKQKKIRLLKIPNITNFPFLSWQIKSVLNGFLIQEHNIAILDWEKCEIITSQKLTEEQRNGLEFAWKVIQHIKSNAVIITKANQTIGIGAGQMNRIDALELALWKAKKTGLNTNKMILASDNFFSFPDNILTIAQTGIKTIIQPGGSMRDKEVIAAAKAYDITMVLTHQRVLKH